MTPPVEGARSSAWFTALLDAAPDAMVIVGPDGRIVMANAQVDRLFGWSREALVGQPIEVLIPVAQRARHEGHRAGYAERPHVREMGAAMELTALRHDGSTFPVEIRLSPFETAEGRHVTAAVRDMTDRRRIEHELRAANLAKDEFVANMTHELRTPLNAILGFSDLLEAGAAGPLVPSQQEFVTNISRSGRHLLELINGLLDLSRLDAGRFAVNPEPVDVRALVEGVNDTLRAVAQGRNVQLGSAVHDEARVVTVDPLLVRQILYNLLSNALKFTPASGSVDVVVVREGDQLRIDVTDTGIGIAEADLGRLFQRFTQLETGPAKRHAGTGLGLALTRELVLAMNGTIGVRSTPEVGSTFTVLLPAPALV